MMDKDKENETENSPEEVDLAALREENRLLGKELAARERALAQREQEIAARQEEIDSLKRSLEETQARVAELEKELEQAVGAYRGLAIAENPGVLGELVSGETIQAIDESLASARALMERVRQEVEAEASRARVPAGAPARTAPDLSGLSAREKIQYAVGGNR